MLSTLIQNKFFHYKNFITFNLSYINHKILNIEKCKIDEVELHFVGIHLEVEETELVFLNILHHFHSNPIY